MCLAKVWTDEEMNKWLEGQGEVVEVWKAATIKNEQYHPCYPYRSHRYQFPMSLARRELIREYGVRYWSGYHFFLNKEEAENYGKMESDGQVIKCFVLKKWITAIGESGRTRLSKSGFYYPITIVASQAVFPHFPDTEARLEDIPQEQIAVAVGQEG